MKINFISFNPFVRHINSVGATKATNPFLNPQYDTFERQNINFSGSSNSNFQIRDIKNMHCPACGLLMLDEDQINAFVNDIFAKRGTALIDTFEKYEDESIYTGEKSDIKKGIYRPQKQQIVDILKAQAMQNPNMNLVELVQLEAKNRYQNLINQQLDVVDKLENYLDKAEIPSDKRMEINDVVANYRAQIVGESGEQFSRKRFKYALSKIQLNGGIQKNILKIADELPRSDNNIDSFFIKYSKVRNPREIAKKFVFESKPTAEHLVCASDNGASNSKNFICDCADCNSRRQDLEFKYWAAGLDNFQHNLQTYLDEVQTAIDKGELDSSYKDYIPYISKRIHELSDGKLNLKDPKIKRKAQNKDSSPIRKHKLVSSAKKKQKKDRQTLLALTAQLDKLQNYENFQVIREYYSTKAQIKKLNEVLRKSPRNKNNEKMQNVQNSISKAQKRLNVLNFAFEHPSKMQEKIREYKLNLSQMEEIKSKIDNDVTQIQREDIVKQELQEIGQKQRILKENNAKILENPDFNPDKINGFNEYLRLKSLLELSYQMKDKGLYYKLKDSSKGSKIDRSSDAKLVIDIASNSIKEQIEKMLEKDSVIYFINRDEIEKNSKKIKALKQEYDAIQQKKDLIVQMNEQLAKIGKDKTYGQVLVEYNELKQKLQTTVAIKNINQLRTEISNLKDKIDYNKEILDSLTNIDEMSDEEFDSKLAMLYQ